MIYKSKSYFSPGDCNTICVITGFKVKMSQTVKTWDGKRVIPEANSPRHPQDFPPHIMQNKVFSESVSESEPTVTATAPQVY